MEFVQEVGKKADVRNLKPDDIVGEKLQGVNGSLCSDDLKKKETYFDISCGISH